MSKPNPSLDDPVVFRDKKRPDHPYHSTANADHYNPLGFKGAHESANLCPKCDKINKSIKNDLVKEDPDIQQYFTEEFNYLLSEIMMIYYNYIYGLEYKNDRNRRDPKLLEMYNRIRITSNYSQSVFTDIFRKVFLKPFFNKYGLNITVPIFKDVFVLSAPSYGFLIQSEMYLLENFPPSGDEEKYYFYKFDDDNGNLIQSEQIVTKNIPRIEKDYIYKLINILRLFFGTDKNKSFDKLSKKEKIDVLNRVCVGINMNIHKDYLCSTLMEKNTNPIRPDPKLKPDYSNQTFKPVIFDENKPSTSGS